MNRRFREAMREAYQNNNAVYTDFKQYDAYMERFAAEDMLSYSLPRTCLLIPDVMEKLCAACAEHDVAKVFGICNELESILRNEHGIRPYHAAWSINCWLYTINAHICYFNSEYTKLIETMPSDKLIPLANSGDAYASEILYSRDVSQKEWLTKTEQYDHPAAIYFRSVELRGDFNDPEKNQQALKLCLEAMDMGYMGVSSELAQLYHGVEGIEKNAVEAFKYALMGLTMVFTVVCAWCLKPIRMETVLKKTLNYHLSIWRNWLKLAMQMPSACVDAHIAMECAAQPRIWKSHIIGSESPPIKATAWVNCLRAKF